MQFRRIFAFKAQHRWLKNQIVDQKASQIMVIKPKTVAPDNGLIAFRRFFDDSWLD